ncbi:two-partner secretion domain-containing protein, partial [Verminephrobacter aporrectodeae]
MNRNRYRIVFNKRRGERMAVAETAQGSGKSAAGEGGAGAGSGQAPSSPAGGRCRPVALAMWLALGALPMPMAWAQIIADPAAPANQRPTVLSDGTRPLVNIQTPSAAGLSRNTYKQFDVPASGIVLNNSSSNPWLYNGVLAKTILNEVNSAEYSHINGAVTVNGAAAQVIVANPSGIYVNGGSFANTSRLTLTTGTAQVSNGALTGFTVSGPRSVTIGPGGLNSSATPYTDIMSRAFHLLGGFQAQDINVTLGAQTVAYDTGLVSNQDSNADVSPPAFEMDSSALGGMYANSIHILATQAGLGVRNHGTWRAGGGQIVVTVNGRLENHGTWQAGGGQIAVTANDRLENSGTIAAGAVSLVAAKGHIQNTGSIQGTRSVVTASEGDTYLYGAGLVQQTAGSAVVISAKGDVKLFNDAYHGATQVSSSTAGGGHVSISAGHNIDLDDGTSVAADKDVQLRSDDLVLARDNASVTSRSGNVSVLSGTGIVLYHSTVTGQQVHLETGAEFRDSEAGIWITGGNVRGQTQTTALATGDIRVFDPGSAAVSSGGNVHIQAARAVDIAAGNTITADRHMSVMAGTALTLHANSGRTATNGEKVRLSAGGNMLVSGGSVMATGSNLSAGKNLTIEANDGSVSLNALSNAAGASVDRITLSAGDDLKVSAFKGSLLATGLQANGRNISLASTGTTRVASSTAYVGSNVVAVSSELSASEGITLASVAGGTSG